MRGVQAAAGVKRDGQYGERTRAAVMKFQREHGLVVDGIVGHQTALAMAGKLKAAKRAKPGKLKPADRTKLARARAEARNAPRAPERARGGRVV